MLTPLQERKLDRCFGHLDVNGNGHIDHEDLVALAARIMGAFGESPTGSKGNQMLTACDRFWEALVAAIDLDGDRRISPEEWRAGMAGAFIDKPGGWGEAMRPAAQAALDLADTDGDGILSLAEFRAIQAAYGTSAEDAEIAFNKIDADGGGRLTVDELVEASRQYYTGADPDAAGNWLFGPV